MYLTQGNFFGKTGPMDPARKLSENPKFEEKYYPNPWMEDRNLKSIHKRVNTVTSPTFKTTGNLVASTAESD